MSPASGDIPGLWRGASPTGSGISPALRGMSRPRWCGAHTTHMCHMSVPLRRSKPTQQHVKRCLCNTTRPSEGSWCAAVAAAGAAFVPGGEARTSEPHREARRGEARGGQSRPQTTVCRCGAPSSTEQRSRRDPDSASSEGYAGGRRAAEPAAREGAWPRRAQGGSRGQALWSLGGASPRAHTQAVVSRLQSCNHQVCTDRIPHGALTRRGQPAEPAAGCPGGSQATGEPAGLSRSCSADVPAAGSVGARKVLVL